MAHVFQLVHCNFQPSFLHGGMRMEAIGQFLLLEWPYTHLYVSLPGLCNASFPQSVQSRMEERMVISNILLCLIGRKQCACYNSTPRILGIALQKESLMENSQFLKSLWYTARRNKHPLQKETQVEPRNSPYGVFP